VPAPAATHLPTNFSESAEEWHEREASDRRPCAPRRGVSRIRTYLPMENAQVMSYFKGATGQPPQGGYVVPKTMLACGGTVALLVHR
jgi:hypothetical protein